MGMVPRWWCGRPGRNSSGNLSGKFNFKPLNFYLNIQFNRWTRRIRALVLSLDVGL